MSGPFDNPFRFTVQASSPPGADASSWMQLARRAEDLGYDLLTVADHFDDQLAPIPAVMAAATATTTLRVGTMVLSNDYRHPAVLAKEAATIDVLSGGRLELGLGAGWMRADYEQAGLRFAPARERIDRLAEAVMVIKRLLGGGTVDFEGEHYTVRGLRGTPEPVQRPHPPILIGGGGRRLLTLAAREADVVGLSTVMASGAIDVATVATGTAEATDERVRWVREAAGDRWHHIEIQVRVHIALVTEQRDRVAESLAGGFGLTVEQALATPHALCGDVEQIVETLLERRDRWGISVIGLGVDALEPFAPVVERLAGK
jgi:probable F420-dependent oxidoreductase